MRNEGEERKAGVEVTVAYHPPTIRIRLERSENDKSTRIFNEAILCARYFHLLAHTTLHDKLTTFPAPHHPHRVLTGLRNMVLEWIIRIAKKKGYSEDVQRAAGGKLYTSGSYRLGVHEPGADIDTICVTPSICEKEDFFGELKETLLAHKDVTNLNSVEGARVPIITFDWEEVNIDLLFARLQQVSVTESIDIDNDQILANVSVATEKSLNGPRVTNLIAKLVSGTPERYQGFLKVVRCVRKVSRRQRTASY